jgi:LysR family transcriptional regulator, low CO2-responsive transcriptional regulator
MEYLASIFLMEGHCRVDLNQLTAFDRIVREGSFSRAALALGIGQPGISSRIHALEAAIGGALFTRGRKIALTPLGEAFLPYARRILEMVEDGIESARLSQAGRRGRIRLGALGSLAGGLVAPALAELVRAQPEIECFFRAGDHESLVELLLDGIVELALITWPCRETLAASLHPLLLLREPVVLVVHPRHQLARHRTVDQDELARKAQPLLRLRWWQTHHPEITRLAQLSGTSVEVPMETARGLVLRGVGAGFFTRTYIADDLARHALAQVHVRGLPAIFRDSALVRRKSQPLSPPAAALVEAVRGQAARMDLLATSPSAARGAGKHAGGARNRSGATVASMRRRGCE